MFIPVDELESKHQRTVLHTEPVVSTIEADHHVRNGVLWDSDNWSCAYDSLLTLLWNMFIDHRISEEHIPDNSYIQDIEEEEDDDDDVIAQTLSRKRVVVSTSTHVDDDGELLDSDNISMRALKHSAVETAVTHGEHTVNKGKGVATAGDAVSVEVRRESDKVIAGHEDAVDEQRADDVHKRDDESDAAVMSVMKDNLFYQ
ncbi:hypothetical protein SCP_0300920 [Sparassis crispa]|uniref:Uncharacterized protein n=1 Tax=Sparassis crispa TaxID=139825 RepID=A0A401GDY8_9APHY|nr:hypothetical protein SCP_0300920 [Sparassis crispa]GBE80377.1 hypothetical protein SCP_0300920 [Sparassis crispa]